MATIVTNPNYIQVDGARIQKGTRDIIPLENGVRLQNTGSGSVVDILVDGTTIDGQAVADRDELLTYLDSQGFKSGGSSPGTEVSWGGITGDIEDQADLIDLVNSSGKSLQELFDENGEEGFNTIEVEDQKLQFTGGDTGEFLFTGNVGQIFAHGASVGMHSNGRGQLSFNQSGPNILQNEGNSDGLRIDGDAGPITISSQGATLDMGNPGISITAANHQLLLEGLGGDLQHRVVLSHSTGNGLELAAGSIRLAMLGNISNGGLEFTNSTMALSDPNSVYSLRSDGTNFTLGFKFGETESNLEFTGPDVKLNLNGQDSENKILGTDGNGNLEYKDLPQLELVDGEGSDKGWRLLGQSDFKGVPGNNSVDLSVALDGTNRGATGVFSSAFGQSTRASGDSSSAFGRYTIASGSFSSAFGYTTTASGYSSSAFGSSTRASGDHSLAFGRSTTASGYSSSAFGNSTTASGYSSSAFGNNTTANEYASLAIGRFSLEGAVETSWTPGSPIFKVGNGTGVGDRSNAYVLNNDGTSTQYGVASYGADYSGNFTDRSLVDKEYVDGLVNGRLTEAQRSAINALVSPETDYADMAEATAAIKSIIDALQTV